MEDAFRPGGASPSCAPIGPLWTSAAVTSGPAAPAALNGSSSLSDPLQNSSAQHRHHLGNREITGLEAWRDSEGDPPPPAERRKASISTASYFFFSPQTRTGECAHRVAGVCVSVCLPVWITMMQSAAVLPTESPVKSLPEILGVPLQRKPFSLPVCFFLSVMTLETGWRAKRCCRGLVTVTEDEERRLNISVLGGHVQASDVSYWSDFSAQKWNRFIKGKATNILHVQFTFAASRGLSVFCNRMQHLPSAYDDTLVIHHTFKDNFRFLLKQRYLILQFGLKLCCFLRQVAGVTVSLPGSC